MRSTIRAFMVLATLIVLGPAAVHAVSPGLKPPEVLKDWFDYARKRFPPADCPQDAGGNDVCVIILSADLTGDVAQGEIRIGLEGRNLSGVERTVNLVGPASLYSLHDAVVNVSSSVGAAPATVKLPVANTAVGADVSRLYHAAPFFTSANGPWRLTVPPGDFSLTAVLRFQPKPVMPITLADGIGAVNAKLAGGRLEYDENTGLHGGPVQIIYASTIAESDEPPQVRIVRVFRWGSVPTFSYHVSAGGLKKDASVVVKLLGDEAIETLDPNRPYRVTEENGAHSVETTLSPAVSEIEIRGHYPRTPESFTLGDELPFEVWLYVADARHPAEIATEARPIDPGEFSEMAPADSAKAYLVRPNESFAFKSLALTVDEGRKGKAKIRYDFTEGARGHWLEKLHLNAEILGQDRLVIPTPETPVFAGLGGEGLELYHDAASRLSLRLPPGGLNSQPIEVHWNAWRQPVWFFDIYRAVLPAQNVFIEEQNAGVRFRPGVVPLWAGGADKATGDLMDQFHLYGLLVGILAFFLCRGLKFHPVLCVLVTLLFVGLFLQSEFPTTATLILIAATLPWVLLSEESLKAFGRRRFLKSLTLLIWVILYLCAAVPLTEFARTRVYQALHPEAGFHSDDSYGSYGASSGGFASAPEGRGMQVPNAAPPQMARPMQKAEKLAMDDISDYEQDAREEVEGLLSGSVVSSQNAPLNQIQSQTAYKKKIASTDYNTKTVSINASAKYGRDVTLDFYHLVQGSPTGFMIVLAGPVARGAWLLLESCIILSMMVGLIKRGERLWKA